MPARSPYREPSPLSKSRLDRFQLSRRRFVAAALAFPAVAKASGVLRVLGGARGGAFLPYAQALAARLSGAGLGAVEARETAGSVENLRVVAADPEAIGLAFLPAYLDLTGAAGAASDPAVAGVRALFAMYRSTYQIAVRANGPTRLVELDRRTVGVGPRGGADAAMFARVAADVYLDAKIVHGSYADLADGLVSGAIDALWIGAASPIPAIADLVDRIGARVFGLSAWELARLVERHAIFAPAIVPPGTYRGQTASFTSVAAWNFVVANERLPAERAQAIVQAALAPAGLSPETTAANAVHNRVLPFHPGALRHYRSIGLNVA